MESAAPRGRGTGINPANRFEEIAYELDESVDPADRPAPKTRFFRDATRSVLVRNDSPDIPFTWGLNPYRGCEHGCAYCYARPYHEYLGLSAGLDFETMIFVKEDAPELLERELAKPSWVPDAISISGVTDPYQPAERRFEVTRRCLRVLADCRAPVGVVTKNALAARDADLFAELARWDAVRVFVSITTLDAELARRLEPRASTPERRLGALRALSRAGVPVGVMAAPMIPGLNDHELPRILEAAAEAGARWAGFTVLRLPYTVKDVFLDWLDRHEPGRKAKVVSQLGALRGGGLNDARFGSRMRGEGVFAAHLKRLFEVSGRRFGLNRERQPLSAAHFRRPGGRQLRLL
ncbi:MAG: PA0069 family radical SAM protein [Elusimicrobia bacterium]|nr:PA0069 family radical SAM protein [Elusimicrobiota bacterium]